MSESTTNDNLENELKRARVLRRRESTAKAIKNVVRLGMKSIIPAKKLTRKEAYELSFGVPKQMGIKKTNMFGIPQFMKGSQKSIPTVTKEIKKYRTL